jgi:hypothetical protein
VHHKRVKHTKPEVPQFNVSSCIPNHDARVTRLK